MTKGVMVTIREVYVESDPNRGNMVILKENAGGDRFFLMFVGEAEFTAIAKEKGLVDSKRPLTHDFYLSIMEKAGVEFLRIEISEMREETYYANVLCRAQQNDFSVDSRPSDAVALALNRRIPILVHEDLFRRKLTAEEVKEYEGLVKMVKF
ncbi:MAG: bifunctional nuclease family protein [Deltaproteobacteria bacterium]|nr:bifunctional nuclease family protein [Deltaproteobacteria bacterium]